MIKIKTIKNTDVFKFVDETKNLQIDSTAKYQYLQVGIFLGCYVDEQLISVMIFRRLKDYVYYLDYYNGIKGNENTADELYNYFLKVWRPVAVLTKWDMVGLNKSFFDNFGFNSMNYGFKYENDIKANEYGKKLEMIYRNSIFKEPKDITNVLSKYHIETIKRNFIPSGTEGILVYDNREVIGV